MSSPNSPTKTVKVESPKMEAVIDTHLKDEKTNNKAVSETVQDTKGSADDDGWGSDTAEPTIVKSDIGEPAPVESQMAEPSSGSCDNDDWTDAVKPATVKSDSSQPVSAESSVAEPCAAETTTIEPAASAKIENASPETKSGHEDVPSQPDHKVLTQPQSDVRPLTPINEIEVSETVTETPAPEANVVDEVETISFHIDADAVIRIECSGAPLKLQVLSCSVAASSDVWRKLFYGNEANQRPQNGEWVLKLRADSRAMQAIMNIIHFRFQEVPTTPSLDELMEICLLISQYKCAHLVQPWAAKWVAELETFVSHPNAFSHCHKVIWISWALGNTKLFEEMVDALAVSVSLDAEGDLVNVDGMKLKDMVLPSGLMELISQTRTETIQKMFNGMNAPIQALSNPDRDQSTVKYCRLGQNQAECEAMIVGSTLLKLIGMGLYPIPPNYTDSIKTLKTKLESIHPTQYVGPEWTPHKSHMKCSLGLQDMVHKCLKEMPVPMGSAHREHLIKQARVSGLATNMGSPKLEAASSGRFKTRDLLVLPGSKNSSRKSKNGSSSVSIASSDSGSDHGLSTQVVADRLD